MDLKNKYYNFKEIKKIKIDYLRVEWVFLKINYYIKGRNLIFKVKLKV